MQDKIVIEYYKYKHMKTWKEIFEAMSRSIPDLMEEYTPTAQALISYLDKKGL